jgi:ABC-type transport system involved in cytochrome c biogenesis permease component
MKTFIKILLIAALLIVAIKLSPVIFVAAFVGLFVAAVLGAVGVSLIVALAAVLLAFAVALSPIWIPVLAIVGIVSLFRKADRTPPVMTT